MKLIELIIGVAAVGVVVGALVGFGGCGRGCSGAAQADAQQEANSFLQQMNIKGKAICAKYDTDGDGYISCPYTVEGSADIHPLECASGLIYDEGCRPPKMVIPTQGR